MTSPQSSFQMDSSNDIGELEEKMQIDSPKQNECLQDVIEPYEDWKKRMLEGAYAELKDEEKNKSQSITPRKFPRKFVQKFSPYKTPTKNDINTKDLTS